MLKKSLLAIATIGAFAGSAVAADVTVYGLVDYGFNYQHVDADIQGVDAQDNFEMRSGMNSGSRFGFKGSEDLGNGLTVGFVLENGFDADSGNLGYDGRIFGRESQVYLSGNFGTVSFGRMGQLASANGTYGLLNGDFSPFSGGWADSVGARFLFATGYARYDNTITYKSPEFAGLNVFAQYSFENDSVTDGAGNGDEGKSNTDRYYGIGAKYKNGNLALVGIVDQVNYRTEGNNEDQLTGTLGASYDFGVVKTYLLGQYFKDARNVGQKSAMAGETFLGYKIGSSGYGTFTDGDRTLNAAMEGYGLALGASVPAFGGSFLGQIGYMDADNDNGDYGVELGTEVKRWNVTLGYTYNLSKRTSVYAAAAYTKDDVTFNTQNADNSVKDSANYDPTRTEVVAGLIHKF